MASRGFGIDRCTTTGGRTVSRRLIGDVEKAGAASEN